MSSCTHSPQLGIPSNRSLVDCRTPEACGHSRSDHIACKADRSLELLEQPFALRDFRVYLTELTIKHQLRRIHRAPRRAFCDLPAFAPFDPIHHDRMTSRAFPFRVEPEPSKFCDDLVGDPNQDRLVLHYTSVSKEELARLYGLFGRLEMVEDIALNWVLRLLLIDLVPDFGEPTVVAAAEVLPRDDALPIERSECLVQAVAIR